MYADPSHFHFPTLYEVATSGARQVERDVSEPSSHYPLRLTLANSPYFLLYDRNAAISPWTNHSVRSHSATEFTGPAHVRVPHGIPQIFAPHLQGYDQAWYA